MRELLIVFNYRGALNARVGEDVGLVAAGENVLSTTLRKEETVADLKEDGTIVWRRRQSHCSDSRRTGAAS